MAIRASSIEAISAGGGRGLGAFRAGLVLLRMLLHHLDEACEGRGAVGELVVAERLEPHQLLVGAVQHLVVAAAVDGLEEPEGPLLVQPLEGVGAGGGPLGVDVLPAFHGQLAVGLHGQAEGREVAG
jgi:hypothetical protein